MYFSFYNDICLYKQRLCLKQIFHKLRFDVFTNYFCACGKVPTATGFVLENDRGRVAIGGKSSKKQQQAAPAKRSPNHQ
jgi:hypothetical protein